MGKQQEKFFYGNRETIDTLIKQYDDFKTEIYRRQKEKIAKYFSLLSSKPNPKAKPKAKAQPNEWWIYNECVLGIYCKGDETEHRIGIECVFEEETYEYPLGKFHIYIASWAEPHFGSYKKPKFGFYEDDLRKAYPDSHIYSKFKNRLFLPVAAITPEEYNQDFIIYTLEKTYKTLTNIIKQHE